MRLYVAVQCSSIVTVTYHIRCIASKIYQTVLNTHNRFTMFYYGTYGHTYVVFMREGKINRK